MNIFAINLDRSTDRWQEFQHVNAHLKNVTRFSAVEGKAINKADLIQQKIFEEPILYSDGAIGNALSHLGIWKNATKGSSFVTIMEDDAIIHRDFEAQAPALLHTLPKDWDIVLWGWNFDSVVGFDIFPGTSCTAHFSQEEMRQHWQSIQKSKIQPSLHKLHYAFGSVGYSISPAGAKKLIQKALPIKPFMAHIPAFNLEIQNNAMDCVIANLSSELNIYACFPPLILTKNERAGSSVQQNNREEGKERDFRFINTANFYESRKFKKKYARYLFKKGDRAGGVRWYLKSLLSRSA